MSLVNNTSWSALDVPMLDPAGNEVVVVTIKATFERGAGGRMMVSDEQAPVRLGDVAWEPDNPRSSLRYPSDVCDHKHGADVVVVGEAVSRTPVTSMDVAVKVRDVVAPLLVHGERVFYRSLARMLIGPAAKFTHKPVVYERAYGGASEDWSMVEARNPAGVGVAVRTSDLEGRPAPQIEHPARRHQSAGDDHPPMGFGAIASHWSPRKERVGTFDDVWKQTRMPIPPADFDQRFYNVAHPSLQLPRPLAPGEAIAVLGMSDEGLFRFELPDLRCEIRARSDESGSRTVRPSFDTVIVEPGVGRLEVVARQAFRIGRGRDVLREVVVDPV